MDHVDVVLRPYREGDLPRLQDIAVAAWEPVFASFRSIMGEMVFETIFTDWRNDKRDQIASECRGEHGAKVLVAELDDEPVGFCDYYLDQAAGLGEISNNAVHPDHQNRGIATRLYTAVLDEMRAAGLRCVQVSTGGDASHAPARRAYEKVGFRPGVPSLTLYRELTNDDPAPTPGQVDD